MEDVKFKKVVRCIPKSIVDYESIDLFKDVKENIYKGISNDIEKIIIDGLGYKGYLFSNYEDLLGFVKNNITPVLDKSQNKITYFVDKIPFLEYYPSNDIIKLENGNENNFILSVGSFRYI